jgi:hypothetical protein
MDLTLGLRMAEQHTWGCLKHASEGHQSLFLSAVANDTVRAMPFANVARWMTAAIALYAAESFMGSTIGAARLPRRRNGTPSAPLRARDEIRFRGQHRLLHFVYLLVKPDDLQFC